MAEAPQPKLSLIVTLNGEAGRVDETLFCLSPRFQQRVAENDYEIVVVEPASGDIFGEERATAIAGNLRYIALGTDQSPIRAGLARARAPFIGLLLDGTALVTPRLIEHALLAARLPNPLALVPSYVVDAPAASEPPPVDTPLGQPDWRRDGYAAFGAASFGPDNPNGFLCPVLHASCLFTTRSALEAVALDAPGFQAALSSAAGSAPLILAGEGVFLRRAHSSSTDEPVAAREPKLLGAISGPARRLVHRSAHLSMRHHAECTKKDLRVWRDSHVEAIAPDLPRASAKRSPLLSILVVFHRIPRQAENTLYSLSARHQRNVNPDDYEIIVVENSSDAVLGEARARAHGENIRYFYRQESGVSPAPAVNFALEQARGALIGLIIDGAHMVTPGIVEHALLAANLHDNPIVSVPAHHLGNVEHHLNRSAGHDQEVERRMLESIAWKANGYALFDIACWSGANHSGFLCPAMESNCIFCTRVAFEAIGRADERFDLPGGGLLNQDIFARLCRARDSRFIVLAGEGSFHQFHGGVSTSEYESRDELLETLRLQYEGIHGHRVIGFDREPLVFGSVAPQAQPFLKKSAELSMYRHQWCVQDGRVEWPND